MSVYSPSVFACMCGANIYKADWVNTIWCYVGRHHLCVWVVCMCVCVCVWGMRKVIYETYYFPVIRPAKARRSHDFWAWQTVFEIGFEFGFASSFSLSLSSQRFLVPTLLSSFNLDLGRFGHECPACPFYPAWWNDIRNLPISDEKIRAKKCKRQYKFSYPFSICCLCLHLLSLYLWYNELYSSFLKKKIIDLFNHLNG